MDAADLHDHVARLFNAGDLDGLVALYEPDAQMMRDDGTAFSGLHAIRTNWAEFIGLGGALTLDTDYVIEAGDVALLSNTWTFRGNGMTFSSKTAEVARRGADGTWRYVIDNPFAAPAEANDGASPD